MSNPNSEESRNPKWNQQPFSLVSIETVRLREGHAIHARVWIWMKKTRSRHLSLKDNLEEDRWDRRWASPEQIRKRQDSPFVPWGSLQRCTAAQLCLFVQKNRKSKTKYSRSVVIISRISMLLLQESKYACQESRNKESLTVSNAREGTDVCVFEDHGPPVRGFRLIQA